MRKRPIDHRRALCERPRSEFADNDGSLPSPSLGRQDRGLASQPRKRASPIARIRSERGLRIRDEPKFRLRSRAALECLYAFAVYPASLDHRGRSRRGRCRDPRRFRRGKVHSRSVLAHLLERLASASAASLDRLPRGSRPSPISSRGGRRARFPFGCGETRRDRSRMLRRLGARTDRHRLSAQSRADVVRQHLDLHVAAAVGVGRGVLSPASPRRRSRHEHSLLAVGRRAAYPRQDLPGAGGKHRHLHGGALSSEGRRVGRRRPTPERSHGRG